MFILISPRWVWGLAILPLLWGCRKVATGHFLQRTPLDWAILLLLVMVLVSLYATFDVSFSLGKVTGVLLGVTLFYAAVAYIGSLRELRWAIAVYIAMGMGIAGLGLLGIRWPNKVRLLSGITQRLPAVIRGLPGAQPGFSANEVAGVLLWFVPLQSALTVWSWWSRRSIALCLVLTASLAITGGTLLLTQSRGGFVGLTIGVLLLLALSGRWGRVMVGIAGLAVLVAVVSGGVGWIGELFADSMDTAVGTVSLAGRVEIWSRALYGIADFPFTGMGMNAFRRVVHILYPLFIISPDFDIAHAHNEFLQAALDLGIPGSVAFVALHLMAFWMLFQVERRAADPFHRALAVGLAGGLLAHVIYGMTDAVALGARPGFIWWAMLALIVVVHEQV